MKNLKDIFEIIKELFEDQQFCFDPTQLYEPIDYTLRLGGKRLRPALLLASNQMMGGDLKAAESAAVGIETFHNFTLLHDDVMDRSPLRRGKPTVWTKWNENTAILSGDTMFALAWRYFLKEPRENLQAILECFNETAIEVCEGQQYDMDFEQRDEVAIAEYMMMIRKKTAVLLAGAMKIGAMYAGANKEDLCHIYDCGINMGLAFQIQDDLLDAYADQNTFGKPVGQDIRDHKKTYMILRALELSAPQERDGLKKLYNTPIHNDETVKAVLERYDRLGMKKHAEEEIFRLMQTSETELENVKKPDERKQPIKELISILIGRNR